MRTLRGLVAMPLLLVAASAASAADYPVLKSPPSLPPPISYVPVFSVVGTLSATWTDNALFSRDNRRSDVFVEPDISLRMDGRIAPGWSYRLYARTELERFGRVRDADGAFALWGTRINHDIGNWRVSGIYENRYQFGGIYQTHLFTAHDVKGSASAAYNLGWIILSPFAQGRYRFSDLPEAEYYRLDLALGIEMPLNERWSIVSEPFYEAYWFTGGANSSRVDQIYSVSLGLKYNIAPNISLVTLVSYEERFSNVNVRRYRSLDVGPKLNFAF